MDYLVSGVLSSVFYVSFNSFGDCRNSASSRTRVSWSIHASLSGGDGISSDTSPHAVCGRSLGDVLRRAFAVCMARAAAFSLCSGELSGSLAWSRSCLRRCTRKRVGSVLMGIGMGAMVRVIWVRRSLRRRLPSFRCAGVKSLMSWVSSCLFFVVLLRRVWRYVSWSLCTLPPIQS